MVVPTEFDDKAVYVIDGPDGISQVVASAEEFQVTPFEICSLQLNNKDYLLIYDHFVFQQHTNLIVTPRN